MMASYAIGIDFGTLSGRTVLVDTYTGRVVAQAELPYAHGVMTSALPTGERLSQDWALQHPQDWLDVITYTVPELMRQSGAAAEEVAAIGLDVTASTCLPVTADGTPLCFLPQFARLPHAWPKLWKHHAAQAQARRMTETAQAMGEAWLPYYGGQINAEWLLPKLLQILEECPKVYEAMAHEVEATDWLVWQLTGRQTRALCAAGYKALYRPGVGYPDRAWLEALNPAFADVVAEKLSGPVQPMATRAGGLTPAMAAALGLRAGTCVAVGNVDAHVCLPAAGIDGPGRMLSIVGTSTCHITMAREMLPVPGISGVVQGGVMPGFAAYEAGQCCVGDLFAWLTDNAVPPAYHQAARAAGVSIHQYLTDLAARQRPGAHGLVALDWWNGNRSVLANADLSGLMLGMTLHTRPEDMYRALLESTAYGARAIIDTFRANGVPVDALDVSGGISWKNPLLMQITADVLNLPVRVSAAHQGPALGSAIFAATAAGLYPDIPSATRAMGSDPERIYQPDAAHVTVYEELYQVFLRLHDLFGRGGCDAMARLKTIRASVAGA